MVSLESFPVHTLPKAEFLFQVKDIGYKNPYDFTKEHRHDYFEVFFFTQGGGEQLIDFKSVPIKKDSCYIVFPKQIHLLRRDKDSRGILIQFSEDIIRSEYVKSELRKMYFLDKPEILFEECKDKMDGFIQHIDFFKQWLGDTTKHRLEISLHYLQAFLLLLMGKVTINAENNERSFDQNILLQFQQMVEHQFIEKRLVKDYLIPLNVTEKKLSLLTKKHLGLTPLKVIHDRLLLEIKRILLFEEVSQKETAFRLGFDSQASFSQFVKTKTGFSPTDLKNSLEKIHK